MPSPFPGMDPYLESLEIFPDFHDSFITYLRATLQGSLPAPYFAALGRRIWIEVSRRSIGPDVEVRRTSGPSARRAEPDGTVAIADQPVARPVEVKVAHDEFREPFVEIYARQDAGKRLVTSIEVLSLANKTPAERGRDLYVRRCYDEGPYLREIRYGEDAVIPPLRADQAAWAARILQGKRG